MATTFDALFEAALETNELSIDLGKLIELQGVGDLRTLGNWLQSKAGQAMFPNLVLAQAKFSDPEQEAAHGRYRMGLVARFTTPGVTIQFYKSNNGEGATFNGLTPSAIREIFLQARVVPVDCNDLFDLAQLEKDIAKLN